MSEERIKAEVVDLPDPAYLKRPARGASEMNYGDDGWIVTRVSREEDDAEPYEDDLAFLQTESLANALLSALREARYGPDEADPLPCPPPYPLRPGATIGDVHDGVPKLLRRRIDGLIGAPLVQQLELRGCEKALDLLQYRHCRKKYVNKHLIVLGTTPGPVTYGDRPTVTVVAAYAWDDALLGVVSFSVAVPEPKTQIAGDAT